MSTQRHLKFLFKRPFLKSLSEIPKREFFETTGAGSLQDVKSLRELKPLSVTRNKSSTAAEMGVCLATTDMGCKVGL